MELFFDFRVDFKFYREVFGFLGRFLGGGVVGDELSLGRFFRGVFGSF